MRGSSKLMDLSRLGSITATIIAVRRYVAGMCLADVEVSADVRDVLRAAVRL